MELLKKRSFAVTVSVILIVIATLFGIHKSLGSEVKKIESQFYDGVYLESEGYLQPSIERQLEKRMDAANGLASVATNYASLSKETSALREARNALLDTDEIPAKYSANETLQKAFDELRAALLRQDLTERELTMIESYSRTMEGARSVISASEYNNSVAAYYKTVRKFPVNILKSLAFIDYPVYFEMEG